MAGNGQRKRLGLDTNFLLDLARQVEVARDFMHDGLILAETSLAGIPLLVTSDKHLLHSEEASLLLAFQDADLNPVRPVHPRRLLRALP